MLVLLSILFLVVFVLLLFVIIIFFFQIFDVFLGLPYVATDRKKIDTIIKLAKIKKGETVVDLGSGDGRLLFAAAQRGAHAIGYEINPLLVVLTHIHAKLKGLAHHFELRRQNLWKADLAVADVIFVYGRRKNMPKFEEFIYQNAQKGSRVVVNTNPFPNKEPQKVANDFFLYQV